jgi:hypothetical protein
VLGIVELSFHSSLKYKLTIHLNDEIRKDKYEDFEGVNIKENPSKEALKIKWNLFLKNQ